MSDQSHEPRFVVMKRGLYYRPDSAGFTMLLREAGRFTLDQIAAMCPVEVPFSRDGISYALLDEATPTAPAADESAKVQLLNEEIARLKTQLAYTQDALKAAQPAPSRNAYHVAFYCEGQMTRTTVILNSPWDSASAAAVEKWISGQGFPNPVIANFQEIYEVPSRKQRERMN